ncbi:hypothetical protein [Arthrobacter sp. 35/47]|uniref:hypothetical protein n=1 Tax=Arthrobacter sp. 35/47 TaxID=269454 RepID=UPI00047DF3F4|nr:hypothetical protein [Arthrobacter sp. 35/47]
MEIRKQRNDDDGSNAGVVVPSSVSSRWPGRLAAVLGGILAAGLGTALHAHIWYLAGIGVPAGAIGAVLLATCIAVFVAVAARSVPLAALTGVVAYVLVGLTASFSAGGVIAAGVELDGAVPPVGVAGYVWVVGLAVGTVSAVAVSWWALRPPRRR